MQIALPLAAAVVGGGLGALLAPKASKPPPAPAPLPTRTKAVSDALNADRTLRSRHGAAATMLTGPGGAEAPSPGAKALLGQ